MTLRRSFWHAVETIHHVVYFAPDAKATFQAVGLKGQWMGYFASRAVALGTPPPEGPAGQGEAAITPDDKDWTWTLRERCPDCGFTAAEVTAAEDAGLVGTGPGTGQFVVSAQH